MFFSASYFIRFVQIRFKGSSIDERMIDSRRRRSITNRADASFSRFVLGYFFFTITAAVAGKIFIRIDENGKFSKQTDSNRVFIQSQKSYGNLQKIIRERYGCTTTVPFQVVKVTPRFLFVQDDVLVYTLFLSYDKA